MIVRVVKIFVGQMLRNNVIIERDILVINVWEPQYGCVFVFAPLCYNLLANYPII